MESMASSERRSALHYTKTGADFVYHNSIEALVDTLTTEVIKSNVDSRLPKPKIDIHARFLMNGLRSCSVQVTCAKGCGYSIEGFGDEADSLYRTALTFKTLLESPIPVDAVDYYCKFSTACTERK